MPYQVQISANLLTWPKVCACCLGEPDTKLRAQASRTTGTRVQRTTTSWWEVPHCNACVAHIRLYERAEMWLVAGALLAFAVGLLVWRQTELGTGILAGCVVFGASFIPRSMTRKQATSMLVKGCSAASRAVRYLEWHASSRTFVFTNRGYLDAFLQSNGRKSRSDIEEVSG